MNDEMREFEDIEAELQSLQPRRPSPILARRIERKLRRQRTAKPLPWARLAAMAVAACAIIAVMIWRPGRNGDAPKIADRTPGTKSHEDQTPKIELTKIESRYAPGVEIGGWRVLPTRESQYAITDDKKFELTRGEVYVARNHDQPLDTSFKIKTPAGDIRALGTRYIVLSDPDASLPQETIKETKMLEQKSAPSTGHLTRVCVLAGIVMFANLHGEVQAVAGENAVATASSAPAKLKAEGNYNEALVLYSKLIVDPAHGGKDAAQDLHAAVDCLRRLNRIAEWDALVEKVAAAHRADWRVLRALAQSYQGVYHGGSIIDNKFVRGSRKGRWVNTGQRDRIRSMQLMQQAARHVGGEKDANALFGFYRDFARYFPSGRSAWRLQYLTDLTTLPDYGVPTYQDRTGGAPVSEDGKAVLHALPKSWKEAETDGQRWRWLLDKMAKVDPTRANIPRMMFADFLRQQFGVQTMGHAPKLDLDGELDAGPFSVHTLNDDETIARLATGTKRFTLPDGYRFIRIFEQIAASAPKETPPALRAITYKEYHGVWDKVPDFDKLKPVRAGKLPPRGLDVTVAKRREQYGMVFAAELDVPTDGEYTISLDSDDGSRLRVGKDFVLANDGLHGTGSPVTGKVTLKKGKIDVRVDFFEKTGDEDLIIHWTGPGVVKQYWTKSREKSPPELAMERLADLYQNRLQFDKAAKQWRRLIERFGSGPDEARKKKLSQIVDNWGRFESAPMFCQDQPIKLPYVFRNGNGVKLTATRINVELLLTDIKAYLRSNPKRLDRLKVDPNRIGERLVYHNQTKYLAGKPAAQWWAEFKPRPRHWDRRIDITAPLKEPGAYLLQGKMNGGNTTRLIVWITNTTIIAKPLHRKTLYMVADAKTGQVVPQAQMELFGYRTEYIPHKRRTEKDRYYNIFTTEAAAVTDVDGMVQRDPDDPKKPFQWLAVVRAKKSKRFGVLGFTRHWRSDYRAANYQASKAYVFADRPIYRPDQKVHFKAWVRAARYDMAYVSHFAGRKFVVEIHDPRGQKLYNKTLKANEYGAVTDTITLDEDAALGGYRINVMERPYVDPFTKKRDKVRHLGSTRFRVEEYKKPEFEVTVEAPKDPATLGDKFEATVKAKYYFGAPVTNGMVHYTIKRNERGNRWTPPRPWDWFYGPGYWWFGRHYEWYPGWKHWGCMIGPRVGGNPPEIVAENTVPIGKDGTVKIKIDSAVAKALFGHLDHQYNITAEVTDESRRTIVGKGSVIAARQPYQVHAWMNGGHYRVADTMTARFQARRPDGKAVLGSGVVTLYGVTFDKKGLPHEKALQTWKVKTDENGSITQQMEATQAGQFRIACELTSQKGHVRTGATFVVVTGEDKLKGAFRFNDLELVLDKTEYKPDDRVRLMINTDIGDGTVYLFVRPVSGIYRLPKVIKLDGKTAVRSIDVGKADMPNFFVEAVHVANGKVHTQTRKIVVPPIKRVINVALKPSGKRYEPGEDAKVKIRLTDLNGKPIVGETVVSIYDKSIEYIGGSHPAGDIRAFFWRWQRHHYVNHRHNIGRKYGQLFKKDEVRMGNIGVFGRLVTMLGGGGADWRATAYSFGLPMVAAAKSYRARRGKGMVVERVTMDKMVGSKKGLQSNKRTTSADPGSAPSAPADVAVRKDFADSAHWTGSVVADKNGIAEIELPMPENLTSWKIHAWSLAHGTVVGSGTAEVITAKDLLIRLQAPRFFVQSDEVTLSANVHNYLKGERDVKVRLELGGGVLKLVDGQQANGSTTIPAGQDRRVDWRVRVTDPGEAVVRMIATTGKASDAMEMKFPAFVHGMLKTDSYSAAIRGKDKSAKMTVTVPKKRRPAQTHLEVRYSPSIALAMVDALPYLAGYEYKHSESAVSRFVPLAITRKLLVDMGVNLKAVKAKRTNLNPQEIGDPKKRAAQWKKGRTNPVFDNEGVNRLIARGLRDLSSLQNGDGGWGWCPRSKSGPHSTAYVVHGLQAAKAADVAVPKGMIDRGVAWLENYQKGEVAKITNWLVRTKDGKKSKKPMKAQAGNLDAFVAMILADAGKSNKKMLEYLDRDRTKLSIYAVAMLGLTFDALDKDKQRDMCLRNVKQYLVIDKENQSAHLKLGAHPHWRGYWRWHWYGSDIEAHAYFLKLLCRVEPKGPIAAGIAKYLLNNRKHATYWYCTRDTALSVEALGDFVKASGESKPDMTVQVLVDGKKRKEIRITADNLFTFDNVLHVRGDALDSGKHTVEIRRKGSGPLYVNAYLTNFTLEKFITKAGLEIKVERRYYKLVSKDQKIKATGSRGQALDYRVEHYKRVPLKSGDQLKSGDLVEIELILHSKNDYEHLLFEDFKPAGLEAVQLRSGWVKGAYMELRDEKAAFLIRRLPLGTQTITYRLRAEIPGQFSALPTKGVGVYAPELRANSDEIKLKIVD